MADMRLSAIAIDDLRDLFSGNADAGQRLRQLASAAFPPAPPAPRRGVLHKLGGPLLRRAADAPVVRPGVPTGNDLNDLLAGRDVLGDRLSAVWTLVQLWLADRAWGQLDLAITEDRLNDLDFELATRGVPAEFALRKVFNGRLSVPVKALPGQVTGYVRTVHARQMALSWEPVVATLSSGNAETARQIVDWLGGFERWTDLAVDGGRRPPDLVSTLLVG